MTTLIRRSMIVLMLAMVAALLAGGCKGKETKGEAAAGQESVPFSQQTSHPGLENATTIPGRALAKAESVECQNNLQQLRSSIRMDLDQSGQPPARIDEGAMALVSKCPISGKPYSYDPQTGKVWCTTSGHEKY